jgi:hypothetical protein
MSALIRTCFLAFVCMASSGEDDWSQCMASPAPSSCRDASTEDGWSQHLVSPVPSSGAGCSEEWDEVAEVPAPDGDDEAALGEAQVGLLQGGGEQLMPARRRGRPSKADQLLDRLVVVARGGAANSEGAAPQHQQACEVVAAEASRLPQVEVTAGVLLQLRRGRGFLDPWPLAPSLWAAGSATSHQHHVWEEMSHIAASYLNADVMKLTSLTAAADRLQVSRRSLQKKTQTLASAVIHTIASAMWALQGFVYEFVPRSSRLLFVESMRYDETPMKVKISGASSVVAGLPHGSSTAHTRSVQCLRPHAASMVAWAPNVCEKASTSGSSSKIFQSESSVGMLFEYGSQFFTIVCHSICHLQVLERNTSACMQEALIRQSVAAPVADSFGARLRIATTDKARANILCERSYIASPTHSDWTHVHHPCDIHIVATIFGRVFGFCDDDIAGMIRHGLSLNIAAQMNCFRKALRAEIHHRGVRVIRGSPPLAVRRYRDFMVQLFGRGRSTLTNDYLKALLPNGNWLSYQIELYVGFGTTIDMEEAERVISNGLITALAGNMFKLYPKHRWTGSDYATDQCGLLEAVHRLGSSTYRRYLAMYHGLGETVAESPWADKGHLPELSDDMGEAAAGIKGEDGCANGEPTRDPFPEADANSPAANSKHRNAAKSWWASAPLANLMIIRLVMEPLRSLMETLLTVAGSSWEEGQLHQAASDLVRGRPVTRQYRVALAATGQVERACLQKASLLLAQPTMWCAIPASSVVVHKNCLAFRMLSRLMCSVYQLLAVPHKQMPTRLFAVLADPACADSVAATPPCQRTSYADAHLEEHAGDLTSPKSLAKLSLAAHLTTKDIALLESLNASIRRWLLLRSLHTHTMDFKNLSSEWVLQRARKLLSSKLRQTCESDVCDAIPPQRKRKRTTKTRQGGGGAQRAYFSEQLRQRRLRLNAKGVAATLHAEFKGLSAKTKAEMTRKGRRATAKWKAMRDGDRAKDVTAFGHRRFRQQRLAAEHRLRAEIWSRCQALPEDERAMALFGERLATNPLDPKSFLSAVRLTRSARRWGKRLARLDTASRLKVFRQWQASEGRKPLDYLLSATESTVLQSLSKQFVPLPSAHSATFELGALFPSVATNAAANAESSATSLRDAVAEDWERRHALICHDDASPVELGRGDAETESPCLAAGVCLCSAQGKRLAVFTSRFYAALKAAYPVRSQERVDLKNGYALLHFRSLPGLGLPGIRRKGFHGPSQEIWLHIGLQYLAPWRATFLRMRPVGFESDRHDGQSPRMKVQATPDVFTDYEAMQRCSLADGWEVQFYRLEDSRRPIATFFPGQVTAERQSEESVLIWPRQRQDSHRAARRGERGDSSSSSDGQPDGHSSGDWEEVAEPIAEDGEEPEENGDEDTVAQAWLQAIYEAGVEEADAADAFHREAQDDLPEDPPPPPHGEAEGEADSALGHAVDSNRAPEGTPQVAAGLARTRGKAKCKVDFAGGILAYYDYNGMFQATCGNPFHGSCVLSRKSTRGSHMRGRPCGFLALWLSMAPMAETKEEHWALLDEAAADHANRRASREILATMPEGASLLSCERDLDAGEEHEPLV